MAPQTIQSRDFLQRRLEEERYKQESKEKALAGLGAFGGTVGALLSVLDNPDRYSVLQAERINALKQLNAFELDPKLFKKYVSQGPYGLVTTEAVDRLNELVPPGSIGFKPSDLSRAGRFAGEINPFTTTETDIKPQITVSPSPQPRRLSYEGLAETDIGPEGQKGYIWANPNEPQFGYAAGNLNRGRQTSLNPAINFLAVDMPDTERTRFQTTGEVVKNPDLLTQRGWGQRDFGSAAGDVMFPKEKIRARAEVTAADIYTKLNQLGINPDLKYFEWNPGTGFKELVDTYAETVKKPPVEALRELATPVPALGSYSRNTGQLPVYKQFAVEMASPEAIKRSGIGSVYLNPSEVRPSIDVPSVMDPTLDSDIVYFRLNPELSNPRTAITNYLRRQSGAGLTAGLNLAVDPQINTALAQGDYNKAAAYGGASLAAGAATEAAVKKGLIELAKRKITAPLNVATAVSNPLAAVQLATLAQRVSPTTTKQLASERRQDPQAFGMQGPSANPQLLRAERARRRGGRWKIGPITLPELGISEAGGLFFR